MLFETTGIICAIRLHGEHGAIVRLMTQDHGLCAGYVRGARSRLLRPVLLAGNEVAAQFRGRSVDQLQALTVEPVISRAPLMGEALAVAGIDWITTLAAATLPEGLPYPAIYAALDGVIRAIEAAPSARRWAGALILYERLLLAELGYGHAVANTALVTDWDDILHQLTRLGKAMEKHLFTGRRADVLAARERLTERMKRAV